MELQPELKNEISEDPVPELGRKHFEEALRNAVKSIDMAVRNPIF